MILLYYKLGLDYAKQGRLDDAINCYLKAVELDPNFADAYFNLCLAYDSKGRYKEAKGYYSKAVELNHNYADGYCTWNITSWQDLVPTSLAILFIAIIILIPDFLLRSFSPFTIPLWLKVVLAAAVLIIAASQVGIRKKKKP